MSTLKSKTQTEPLPYGQLPGSSMSDFESLFRRSQSALLRLLLSSGDAWASLSSDPALMEDIRQQVGATSAEHSPHGIEHLHVLFACANKLFEISGPSWSSDMSRVRVSDFGSGEYIVKYPDLAAEISYYFRVLGDDVSLLLAE